MQTNNDPTKGILTAKSLGLLDPVGSDDALSYIDSESSVFAGGFDKELDSGILPNTDVNEQRAALQSGWDHLGAGMGRVAGRFASEVAKMPGAAAGLLAYGTTELAQGTMGEGFGQENFGEYINNAWVKTMEGMSESVVENLPVYVPQAVKDGNLWDNITSSTFWANEGADGLGFLASFFVPGAAMKGLGMIGKGTNNLGRIGNLARKAGLGIKASKDLEIGSIAAMNALFESGAEAANGYDTIYEELKHKEQERQRNWDPANGDYVAKSDEELKSLAGEAAAGIFGANMGILMFPNILQAKLLFGSARGAKINSKLFNQVVDPKTRQAATNSIKLSPWKRAAGYLGLVGKNAASEGFWEEGMQFSAEKYFSKSAEEGGNGFFGNVGGVFETYMSELGGVDMQKGIFLGGVLGGGMSAIMGIGQVNEANNRDRKLVETLRRNYTSFSGGIDVFKKTKDAAGVESLELVNGKPVIDEVKLASVAKEMQEMDDLVALKQAADLAGDIKGSDLILREISSRFALGYLADANNGYENLLAHAKATFELNQTPASEQAIVLQQFEDLRREYKKANNFAQNLRFTKDSRTTTIEAARDKIASTITVLSSRINSLKGVRGAIALEIQEKELDPGLDKETDSEYINLKASLASYDGIITETTDKVDELKKSDPDKLLSTVDAINMFDKYREWAKGNKLDKELSDSLDKAGNTLRAKAEQQAYADPSNPQPGTELDDLTKQANLKRIEELIAKGKSLQEAMKQKDADVDAIEKQMLALADEMKTLGLSQAEFDSQVETIKRFAARQRESSLSPSGRLFHDLNTFTKLYHTDLTHEENLKTLLATKTEKEILANTIVRVSRNTYAKSETAPKNSTNTNFVVVSPEFKWEVYYVENGVETRIGNLPEFNKFKLKNGRYLSELVTDPATTEDQLRGLLGIPNLSKTELEKIIGAQQNLFMLASQEIGTDATKSVDLSLTKDFKTVFHKGKYEYVSKNSIAVSSVENVMSNQPAGTEFVLVRIGKDAATGKPTLTPSVLGEKGKKRDAKGAVALQNEAVAHVQSVDLGSESKAIGSYVMFIKQPSGSQYMVAVKSPHYGDSLTVLFDEMAAASAQIKALLSSTEKDTNGKPLMTDPEKAAKIATAINNKIKKALFIAYPQKDSEMEVSVHPKSGDIWMELSILQGGKGTKIPKSTRTFSPDSAKTIHQQLIETSKAFSNSFSTGITTKAALDFFIEGVTNLKVFRKAYPEKTKFTRENTAEFVTSTSVDVVSGQGISIQYTGKMKSGAGAPPAGGNNNNVTQEQYETAMKGIWLLSQNPAMRALGLTGKTSEELLAQVEALLKAGTKGINPTLLKHYDTAIRFLGKAPSAPLQPSKGFEALKAKFLSWKKTPNKQLRVDESNTDQYLDENGKPYARVTSLHSNKAAVNDPRYKNRGTIIDDLLRQYIDGEITKLDEFLLAYESHPNKNDTFIFQKEALSDLWNIFNEITKFAADNDFELITNLPTFWGTLYINGKPVEVAGTVDLIGIHRQTGAAFIIDLKTSTQNRKDPGAKDYRNYKESDEFQQNAYADLIEQQLGIKISSLRTLPIQSMSGGTGSNSITRFAQNAADGTIFMKVERIIDKFAKKETAAGSGLNPENQTPPPPPGNADMELFKSWIPGSDVSDAMRDSAFAFLNSTTPAKQSTAERIARAKAMALANQVIEAKGMQNFREGKGPAPVFKLGNNTGAKIDRKEALDRLSAILPSGISVQFLDNFIDRFPYMGNAMGYYLNQVIYLLESGESGTAYHEAFHAIFRSVIPNETLAALYADARQRYGKPEIVDLILFAEERDLMQYDLEERELLWYEEKMADDFQKFMANQDSGFFTKAWRKFLSWLGFVQSHRDTLEATFKQISKGSFTSSMPVDNIFSAERGLGITPVMKLLTRGFTHVNGTDMKEMLNAQESEMLINKVTHFAHREFIDPDLRAGRSMDDIIFSVIDDLINLYDEVAHIERFENSMSEDELTRFLDDLEARGISSRMRRLHQTLSNSLAQGEILEAVKYRMSLFQFKEDLDRETKESDEDDRGMRFVKQETERIGGFESLSKWMREYIGFTVKEEKDEFGNSELKAGVPMVKTLDVNKVYNGILRAAANQTDESRFVERLRIYGETNEEAGLFINKFFEDAGIGEDNKPTKGFRLYQGVVKQMSLFKVNYKFVRMNPNDNGTDNFKLSNANLHDIDVVQVEQWNNNYMAAGQSERDGFIENLKIAAVLLKSIQDSENTLTVEELDKLVGEFHTAMTSNGIMSLSKGYTKFVAYSHLPDEHPIRTNRSSGLALSAFQGTEIIEIEDLEKIINEHQQDRTPFAYSTIVKEEVISTPEGQPDGVDQDYVEENDEDGVSDKTGAVTRARRMARGNSIFDETLGSTSFQNAEGETVYAHQMPTYHLVAIADLKNGDKLGQLASDPFLQNNRILRSVANRTAFQNGEFFRLDGTRAVVTDKSGKINIFREQKAGVTFKHMTPREFMMSMLIMAHKKRSGTKVQTVDENGNTGTMTMQSTLIRVLETSSTADFIDMPAVNDTFDTASGNINNVILREFLFRLQSEYSRISRVANEIKEHRATGKIPEGGWIENYHTEKESTDQADLILLSKEGRKNGLRGIKFDKVEKLMYPKTRNDLAAMAVSGIPFEQAMASMGETVKSDITEFAGQEFSEYLGILVEEGIISLKVDPKSKVPGGLEYENQLLPDVMDDNLIGSLADIFFTDWVNTIAINELLIGDEAMGIKDAIDAIKRAKGSNASGFSVAHNGTSGVNPLGEFKKLALTVFKEPKRTVSLEGKEVKGVDIADAQGYMTIRAMKNVLHGLGKLTPEAEVFLDKIERGEKLTKSDIFGNRELVGSVKGDYQLNSMKLVYYDGKRYIKLSLVPLTKQLTSYQDSTGAWKPKIEMTKLHELREQMENFTDSTDPARNGISMSVPQTASKMFTADVRDIEAGEELVFHDTETAYWRLQLENPSNKTTITDPSQIIQLIDSEINDNELLSFQGQSTKASDVAKAFRKAAADARENDFRQISKTVVSQADLKEELFKSIDSGAITPKMKDFLEGAVKTLSASGADSRLIEFFSPNENGEFTFNLNMPATLNKFSELFISHFSKNSLKQKLPGYSVALMSGFGVEVIVDSDTGDVIQSEEYYANRESYPNVTTRRLAHGKQDNAKGIIYSEVLLPAHFAEFLNLDPSMPIPDDIAYMFGIRIPTQDKHSALNLKVVGFLPSFMGSTAIFPDELVALSGADFDIDKMYIHRPAHYVDSDGTIKKFGSATTKDEMWKEFKFWKLNNDKTFKNKFNSLYRAYLERDPSLMTAEVEDTLEMIEESARQLQEIENDLQDTDVAVKAIHGTLSMTDTDWKKYQDLSAKYSGDVLAARTELFEKLKSTKEFVREYKNFLRQQAYMDTLRFFDLPTSPEKLENSTRELNNGVLYNKMLDAKMALYSAESVKEARQAPANLDAFRAMESSEILEGLFNEDFAYQTDNLKGKYTANKTGREGAENIGLAVNGTLAFNILAKMGSRLSEAGQINTAISGRRGAKGFTPDKFVYKNRKGQRINDLFSNITTAMTDNAKELIAGKYGLSFEAIGVFTHMVGLGYTFEESLLLINQPVIKIYLENKRRKASSIITKEEEATFIRDFETAIKVAESQGMVFEAEEENREDLSITEMVANLKTHDKNKKLKNTDFSKNKPLNYHTQRKAFALFQQLEEQTTAVQNLNRLIKLVKGINSDFESIDAVNDALNSWLSEGNPFSEPGKLLEENEMVARNLDLLQKLDKISSKLFIERTGEFKSQYAKMIGQLKNPEYTKDTVKKEIKYNLLSFYFLKMYRKIRSDNTSPDAWVNRSYSNFLVFDKTALDLKEEYLSKNPEASEEDANKLFPTITELYNYARKEVDEYGTLQGKRIRNAFLSYIVSKEATKSKNYHSLEARTRVKENPIFMEKIRDGFEELIEGKYGPNSQNFAIAAINYLMIKDGFQFKNSSFINFIPNKYLRMFGSNSFPGGSAVDRVQRIMMNPREGLIEQDANAKKTKAKWRVDRFKDNFSFTASTLLNRFMGLFAVHPENGYKIFFLRSESGSPFNAALKVKGKPRNVRTGEEGNFEVVEQPMISQFTLEKTGVQYLTFDASNEPGELRASKNPKEQKMTIGNLLQVRPVSFPNDPRNYYAFRRFFKKSEGKNEPPSVYMLVERLDKGGRWVPIDLDYSDPSGFFVAQGAKYMKLLVQGIRGVMNIADADAGAPTYGQPMTSILQVNFGKKKGNYSNQGSMEIDDIMLANMGINIEPSQQNPGNSTDLTDLIPSGNDPTVSSGELASESEIKNAAIALSFDSNFNDMAMTFLNSTGKSITNAMELNMALKEAFKTLPKEIAITKDPKKLLAWLLQNNC